MLPTTAIPGLSALPTMQMHSGPSYAPMVPTILAGAGKVQHSTPLAPQCANIDRGSVGMQEREATCSEAIWGYINMASRAIRSTASTMQVTRVPATITACRSFSAVHSTAKQWQHISGLVTCFHCCAKVCLPFGRNHTRICAWRH